jgi:hypothetical protein
LEEKGLETIIIIQSDTEKKQKLKNRLDRLYIIENAESKTKEREFYSKINTVVNKFFK